MTPASGKTGGGLKALLAIGTVAAALSAVACVGLLCMCIWAMFAA